MADIKPSVEGSPAKTNSMLMRDGSKEPLDKLPSQDKSNEQVNEDGEVPETSPNPTPTDDSVMDMKQEDGTIMNVHRVIVEGITTVKIIQISDPSGAPPPPMLPPQSRYRDDSDTSFSSEDSDSGDESNEKNEKNVGDDTKIRFTIECQDQHNGFHIRYQKNRPSKDVDILNRARKLNSKAPVIEQIITLRYKKNNPNIFERKRSTFLSEMNEDDVLSIDLVIHSPLLINAFRAVVQYYSGESLSGSQVDISHPYPFAFHHRDQLKMYRGSSRPEHTDEYNEECDKHISIFLTYLENYTGLRMEEEEARWERKLPTATFQNLWYLLKPGEDVYATDDSGTINAFVVKSVEGSGFNGKSKVPVPYIVRLWRMDFDGKWIGRSTKTVTIRPFEGEREITKLDVFPVKFYKDKSGEKPLRERLFERGQKFFAMTKGPAYREYNGFTHSTPRRKYNRTRIMIDNRYQPWARVPGGWAHAPNIRTRTPNLAPRPPRPPPPPPSNYAARSSRRTNRDPYISEDDEESDNPFVTGCRCAKCEEINEQTFSIPKVKFHDYDYINPREIECLTEHQLFLCPPQIYGYVLKDRHWHLLEVEQIELPNINEKAIDWLVMSEESDKNMIKAICQQYTSRGADDESFAPDIIDGKGEGQIFLLHGPPGTGKTLTAECVAEFTRRPLISITAGDLGSEPAQLEKNLEDFFKQGTDWDAIVLLDEADVYLEARQAHDLERNSIVSVFLRSLEYYQGILFITTNRIGTFDEAFASRIHVQLHYKALDERARERVWENNFQKLKEEGHRGGQRVDIDRDAKDYIKRAKDVKDLAWNGREIRNAFQTAIALAVYETKEGETPLLKEEHLTKVVQMSAAFKKYVKDMYKMTTEERAQLSQIRARDVSTAPERNLGAGYH